MNLPLHIALRYSLARGGFLSFVSWIAAVGLALGTAVLVIVLSVMNGFERELRDRVLGALPHAVVLSGSGLEDWRPLAAAALDDPRVLAAAPLSRGAALLAAGDRVRAVELTGVLPEEESQVSILPGRMVAGDFDALEAGDFGAVVGARLAEELDVAVGDAVTVVMPDPRVTLAGAFPRQKRLRVVGLYALGTEVDETGLYVHLDDARRLLRIGGEAEGLRLRLTDLFQSEQVIRGLLARAADPDLRGYDWRGTHGNLYEAIGLQKRIMFVLLSLLVAVAAFNVVAMLTMVVRNRRGDIAILRTMGMLPTALVRIFFNQGALIAVVGIGAGLLVGIALTLLLPDIASGLKSVLGRDLLAEYFVRELPVAIRAPDLLMVTLVALAISLLTIWWPARRALAVEPAEELRHE
ncbi:MAG TPA: lipoprotein-releasing ABC transporter permease subunit [Pseudomonadales bacterium]|nr:lipoprotein-releasing ABC transporter permease subunit [Pseudomonadales bacterium]